MSIHAALQRIMPSSSRIADGPDGPWRLSASSRLSYQTTSGPSSIPHVAIQDVRQSHCSAEPMESRSECVAEARLRWQQCQRRRECVHLESALELSSYSTELPELPERPPPPTHLRTATPSEEWIYSDSEQCTSRQMHQASDSPPPSVSSTAEHVKMTCRKVRPRRKRPHQSSYKLKHRRRIQTRMALLSSVLADMGHLTDGNQSHEASLQAAILCLQEQVGKASRVATELTTELAQIDDPAPRAHNAQNQSPATVSARPPKRTQVREVCAPKVASQRSLGDEKAPKVMRIGGERTAKLAAKAVRQDEKVGDLRFREGSPAPDTRPPGAPSKCQTEPLLQAAHTIMQMANSMANCA